MPKPIRKRKTRSRRKKIRVDRIGAAEITFGGRRFIEEDPIKIPVIEYCDHQWLAYRYAYIPGEVTGEDRNSFTFKPSHGIVVDMLLCGNCGEKKDV